MNTTTISGKSWEPSIRYSQAGTCIAELSVSVYDGKDKDGKAKYYSQKCKCFKELAENVGNQVVKGDNIIVVGRTSEEKWEKDGVTYRRSVLIVDCIGKEISRYSGQATINDVNQFGSDVDEQIPF